jgi:predicted MFS family arabinose efflux permease
MAIIGMTIGLSFGVAVVVGPILNSWIGVPGIFWLTAGFALVAMGIVQFLVPHPTRTRLHRDTEAVPALFRKVLSNGQLLRLDFGILAQHAILTASFLAVPVILRDHAGVAQPHQWTIYLPVMAFSVVLMVPLIIVAEKYGKMKPVFLGGVTAIGLSQLLLLVWHARLWIIIPALLIFFTAFNLLEASLPSLISKLAPPESKGTAMGVYSSSQFLGIFVGGAVGGLVQQHFHTTGVFAMAAILAGLWLVAARGMNPSIGIASRILHVGEMTVEQARAMSDRLASIPGVRDAVVIGDEGVAYLKVDRERLDEQALGALAAPSEA